MNTLPEVLNEPTKDQVALIRSIVERTKSLYSLPAVAAEVIQLTNNPQVDTQALKDCIENDPALTAKLLKVVNSSLFGLSREVSDLNQALALLGVKPLKLLVLGFSLPEELFAGVAREQLTWYWKTSLVRAVAARELSQRYWNNPGDDAFLTGLLQDIGLLVLLNQLGEPFARFLAGVIHNNGDLIAREVQSLGFDHRSLSVALLREWKLPAQLIEAISAEPSIDALRGNNATGDTPKVLHMAGLLAELVGQNRLQVLPELLAAGSAYCGFENEQLRETMPELQSKVEQLADVLSLDLENQVSYAEIIVEAHKQMALLCEQVSSENAGNGENREVAQVDSGELRAALSGIANQPISCESGASNVVKGEAIHETAGSNPASKSTVPGNSANGPHRDLTLAVGSCRSRRQPLSLLIVSYDGQGDVQSAEQKNLRKVIDTACRNLDWAQAQVEPIGTNRWQIILPGCERHHAVSLVNEVFHDVQHTLEHSDPQAAAELFSLSAGVSSVTLPPKNFHPPEMIDAAQRCLYAAELSDANVVKSIEIL